MVVPVDGDGRVCLRSLVETDVIVDYTGFFADDSGLDFLALDPIRLFDSRSSQPTFNKVTDGARVGAGQVVRLKIAGTRGVPADATAVGSILTRLGKLEADEVVVEETDNIAQYGLDSPSRSVSVTLEGEVEPRVVDFGATAPGGSGVYARTPTSPRVYTVATFVESSFEKEPFDLRDRDVLHAKRGDVRTLEVRGPEGDYALARTDAGETLCFRPARTSPRLVGPAPAYAFSTRSFAVNRNLSAVDSETS